MQGIATLKADHQPPQRYNARLSISLENPMTESVSQRRTFAIISHPDAGKTTITEKLLLLGNLIQVAGTVKGRKSDRHATSDWMAMEKERGISVTSSVMQFPYHDCMVNLLDTPGHEDFSEDTYRTLTAVDSSLMVIDGAKGVEARTIKLMDVCRLRDTPIFAFVNKMDREIREPIELLDEIESVLKIRAAPINWPIGMGRGFRGVYNFYTDTIHVYVQGKCHTLMDDIQVKGLDSPEALEALGDYAEDVLEELELVKGAANVFDMDEFLAGRMTPVHRDRIAFLRICSGKYTKGMKMKHVRTGKTVRIADAFSFKAGERVSLEEAQAGDIIGLHNHGSIQIGDAFTEGEDLKFSGIPHFAPELFKRIRLKDPLRAKQLQNGIRQLSEEGSTQVFFPFRNNDIIVGAVGQLQFEVVAYRLREEYGVEAIYEAVNVHSARWTECDDNKQLESFKNKTQDNLAVDGGGHLTYLAPTRVNLSLTEERYPEIAFRSTREH